MAQFAAGKARELSSAGSRTLQRATLYEGAATGRDGGFREGHYVARLHRRAEARHVGS